MPQRTKTKFKDHFSEVAARYARHRPTYPPALADFLARTAPRRGLAWDCGCGSGQFAVLLADRFERLIATDASAEQIANATPHPRVDYRCAPAEASGLPGGAVDLAVAAQAVHWFDLDAYYGEVRRVARPGSVLALVAYALMTVEERVDHAVAQFYSNVLDPYWPPERRHVEDGYRSLHFPFEEIEAPRFEMRAEWALADLVGYIETWSAVRALQKARGRPTIEAFRHDLARAWGDEATVRPVRWPLALRVGRL